MTTFRILACTLTMPLLMATGAAFAHGNSHQAEDKKAASVDEAEQMPWGIAGASVSVDRTIDVAMLDKMRFIPATLNIRQGETIRFAVRNDGTLLHEFVLGTEASNAKHAALMVKFPGMEHDAPYMAHVPPGKSGEIVWTFNKAGQFQFACLIAGHYQAGMTGALQVAAD